MHQPFSELTNRTPSPSQHDGFGRKHSPWTAARQKKKTRSVASSSVNADAVLPESYSPEAVLKTGGHVDDIDAEYSLAGGPSPATSYSTASPHSSPPLHRDQDAEVHPAKAYIVDQKSSSPDLLSRFAHAASGTAARSPMWFGSAALQDEVLEANEAGASSHSSSLQHSSSAPSNVLFERFDALHKQQQRQGDQMQQQQHDSSHLSQQAFQRQVAAAAEPAPSDAAAVPGRRRGLVARRRSWGGAELQRLPSGNCASAASSHGISRLAASSCIINSNDSMCLIAAATGDACGLAATATAAAAAAASSHDGCCGFELRSRLGAGAASHGSSYEDLLHRLPWDAADDNQLQQDVCDIDGYRLRSCGQLLASDAMPDSVDWYEQRLAEAAEEGDLAAAQQLWSCMQAGGLKPSRKVMVNFLTCCHYGGADPFEAEQVLREMCSLADTEPDATIARLLAAIDISWQQLHCGF